jgi:D-amino-acid dehydrogenase
MAYEKKGILEYFQTAEKEEHANHTCEEALKLGIDAVMLSAAEVQAMEPQTRLVMNGALYFRTDAHVYPNKVMQSLQKYLRDIGVVFKTGEKVKGFEKSKGRIQKVLTDKGVYSADTVVLSTGSWSRELASKLSLKLPLVGGRGYSVTLEDSPYKLNHPAILMEGRVAITPMDGNKIRFGGTMEITGLDEPPRMKRVAGILDAVKAYLPEFQIPFPAEKDIWYGYRPCSADGLPYIGRSRQFNNMIIATGHAMVGMSLGAGTGKLVSEIANEEQLSVDITAFDPQRFD